MGGRINFSFQHQLSCPIKAKLLPRKELECLLYQARTYFQKQMMSQMEKGLGRDFPFATSFVFEKLGADFNALNLPLSFPCLKGTSLLSITALHYIIFLSIWYKIYFLNRWNSERKGGFVIGVSNGKIAKTNNIHSD